MTLASALNLKECLQPNPDVNQPFPLAYHDRTQHVLPDNKNIMQEQLDSLLQYCEDNSMKVNHDKTKVVLFNTAKKYDFMPRLSTEKDKNLEVVEEFKLLGLMFQSNLRWLSNTDFICQKAYARLWMLRRLKSLGANQNEMERVQKCALYVILGED